MEKRRKKVLLAAVVLLAVVLFAGVYVLYQKLSREYEPENITAENGSTEPQTEGAQQNEGEAPEEEGTQTGEASKTEDDSRKYQAPDVAFFDENGKEAQLSDYLGKPVVLNFWASWCPPCKSEMPHFEKAYQKYPQVQFLMVNAAAGDTLSEARQLIEENGYTFPVFYDNDGNAMTTYRAYSLPQTFFIDSEGNLVTYAIGALREQDLEKGIGMIL